jgi:hypothetical protein
MHRALALAVAVALLAASPAAAHQGNPNGEVVRWIGAPDSDTPAPIVTVTKAQGSARASAATPAPPARTGNSSSSNDGGGASKGLGVTGLILGAFARSPGSPRSAPAVADLGRADMRAIRILLAVVVALVLGAAPALAHAPTRSSGGRWLTMGTTRAAAGRSR